jgi:large subunit ribosomal protein L15
MSRSSTVGAARRLRLALDATVRSAAVAPRVGVQHSTASRSWTSPIYGVRSQNGGWAASTSRPWSGFAAGDIGTRTESTQPEQRKRQFTTSSNSMSGGYPRYSNTIGATVAPGTLIPKEGVLALNNLRDNPGARRDQVRLGRGRGSGKGKTSGRGHNGQKARSGNALRIGFEGGQTPLRLTLPKRGFVNPKRMQFSPVNLADVQRFVDLGRLDASRTITMKHLVDSGLVDKRVGNGVKLLAKLEEFVEDPSDETKYLLDSFGDPVAKTFTAKIDIEVSRVSVSAAQLVTQNGGRVTKVHYNRLGIRALLKPHKFPNGPPKPARPPVYVKQKVDRVGTLPAPEQTANFA